MIGVHYNDAATATRRLKMFNPLQLRVYTTTTTRMYAILELVSIMQWWHLKDQRKRRFRQPHQKEMYDYISRASENPVYSIIPIP